MGGRVAFNKNFIGGRGYLKPHLPPIPTPKLTNALTLLQSRTASSLHSMTFLSRFLWSKVRNLSARIDGSRKNKIGRFETIFIVKLYLARPVINTIYLLPILEVEVN